MPDRVVLGERQPVVYFAQAGDDGPIKIGYSDHADGVADRIRNLQTGCPWPLRLLSVIVADGRRTELALHQQFAANRLSGEWFSPVTELVGLAGGTRSSEVLDLMLATAFERGRQIGRDEGAAWQRERLVDELRVLVERYEPEGVACG